MTRGQAGKPRVRGCALASVSVLSLVVMSVAAKAQPTGGSVVAADKNLDITDQVIARLRTMAPGAPVAATKPATTKPATGPTAGPSGVGRPKSPSQ